MRFFFALACIPLLSPFAFAAPKSTGRAQTGKPFRIVIDPGHGGADNGTVYDNGMAQIAEKDVTLTLAKGVSRELLDRGFEVILTREEDQDLALGARTQLANQVKADLFLSIHMNSAVQAGVTYEASGIETYILNNATDASSKRLAHLENTVISHEGIKTPQQADIALILRDLRLDANLSESKRLACAIQTHLSQPGSHRRNRGVKQALFHVLLGAEMPSVLVEAGFLSSPKDRTIVLSPEGRHTLSKAIASAVEHFKTVKGSARAEADLNKCKVH